MASPAEIKNAKDAIIKAFEDCKNNLIEYEYFREILKEKAHLITRSDEAYREILEHLGWTELMYDIVSGQTPNVLYAISHNSGAEMQINARTKVSQSTALIYATSYSSVDVVRGLLRKGADPRLQNTNGRTALSWAASRGDFQIVQALLDNGAEIDAVDVNGDTPLMHAARNGHLKVVRELIRRGVDINQESPFGASALKYAANAGHAEVVQELLKAGADINGVRGWTPLMVAANQGHDDIVGMLLEKGADANKKNHNGQTALFIAAKNGHLAAVKKLYPKTDETLRKFGSEVKERRNALIRYSLLTALGVAIFAAGVALCIAAFAAPVVAVAPIVLSLGWAGVGPAIATVGSILFANAFDGFDRETNCSFFELKEARTVIRQAKSELRITPSGQDIDEAIKKVKKADLKTAMDYDLGLNIIPTSEIKTSSDSHIMGQLSPKNATQSPLSGSAPNTIKPPEPAMVKPQTEPGMGPPYLGSQLVDGDNPSTKERMGK